MPPATALAVRNLSYRYPDGTPALSNLSFSLAPGESVALVGPNGSGKSTLLLHLNGVLPDGPGGTGQVEVDRQSLSPANLPSIRRKVGLLFQDPDDQLFCPTVFDDVAFGPRQFGAAESDLPMIVRQALLSVGLCDFERRAPHRLSLGEKRRVGLAGLLACQPGLLVLDEPTSNLDPRARREFKHLIASLPCTRLIATHDLEMALELCPRSLLLDAGQLIADAPTPTLLGDEPLMLRHGLERPHSLQSRP